MNSNTVFEVLIPFGSEIHTFGPLKEKLDLCNSVFGFGTKKLSDDKNLVSYDSLLFAETIRFNKYSGAMKLLFTQPLQWPRVERTNNDLPTITIENWRSSTINVTKHRRWNKVLAKKANQFLIHMTCYKEHPLNFKKDIITNIHTDIRMLSFSSIFLWFIYQNVSNVKNYEIIHAAIAHFRSGL